MKQRNHSSVRGLILDMDGVLWRGDQPIGDLPAVFNEISRRGLKVILATNNSTRTPAQYQERLAGLGVTLDLWQIINSSEAAALYLHQVYPQGGPVYIFGENGLAQALQTQGFFHSETGALAVVVGMDRNLNYQKLTEASLLLRSGVPLIASNADRTFPTPLGLVPGAGAIVAALETASDIKAFVVGKPAPEMYKVALKRLEMAPEEVLVVGDRLETDIAGAQAIGCQTALVLSGVSTEAQARNWQPNPDWIASDLSSLMDALA